MYGWAVGTGVGGGSWTGETVGVPCVGWVAAYIVMAVYRGFIMGVLLNYCSLYVRYYFFWGGVMHRIIINTTCII